MFSEQSLLWGFWLCIVYIMYIMNCYFHHHHRASEFLCAGAVNGDGHVAPFQAKVVNPITFVRMRI